MVSIPTEQIGAILLPGVPLLPNNAAPLHIFEPRYRKMLEDAMKGDQTFAIGRLTSKESENLSSCVSSTGLLVKVVINQELPDGRSILIIRGEHPITFNEWTGTLPYPTAEFSEVKRAEVADTESAKKLLRESFINSLSNEPADNINKIKEALDAYESLTGIIDFIAHYSIQADQERSFYLDEMSDSKRASKLLLRLEQV